MFPKEFCTDLQKIKAIVLGADPSTKGKIQFEYVFSINSNDKRYFAPIERNLNQIGLSVNEIYVQNLIPEYLDSETSVNDEWEIVAAKWVQKLEEELNSIDPEQVIPVLVTAERVFKFLNNSITPKAKDIYSQKVNLTELYSNNKLKREIIPFYRNYHYSLEQMKWEGYRNVLIEGFI